VSHAPKARGLPSPSLRMNCCAGPSTMEF